MSDIPLCVNWNSIAPGGQEASKQPLCVNGSEISILAQEHKDLSLVPFATTESQVPAESASSVTSNLRWPQSY